jgi:hypothetical protein
LSENLQLEQVRLVDKLSGASTGEEEDFGLAFGRSSIREVPSDQLRDIAGTLNVPTLTVTHLCIDASSQRHNIFEFILCSSQQGSFVEKSTSYRRVRLPLIRSKNPGKVRLTNAQIEELLG